MQIRFYQNSAEPERVNKSRFLSGETILTGTLRQPTTILNPSVTIQWDGVPAFNYAYIPDFGRYYYTGDPVALTNSMWQISMNVDVLMSHRVEIAELDALVARQENDTNPMLVDPQYIQQANHAVMYYQFPNEIFQPQNMSEDNITYVMSLIGGPDT